MSGSMGLVVTGFGLLTFLCFAYVVVSRWGPGVHGSPMAAVAILPTGILMGVAWAVSFYGEDGFQKAQLFAYGSSISFGVSIVAAILQYRAKRRAKWQA